MFLFPIRPVAKGRPRFGRGRIYTPKKTSDYEKIIASYMKGHKPLNGPLKLDLVFVLIPPKRPKDASFPIVRPDLDNFIKAIMDAANGRLWHDDAQVVQISAEKIYSRGALDVERIEMTVERAYSAGSIE